MKINLDKHLLKNYFVIGDVHGCLYTLLNLVSKLPKDAKLIFVGDLCDKGNFSKEVIEYVIENNHLCVKGNHELLYERHILDAIKNSSNIPWSKDKKCGGLQCIESYDGDIELIQKHLTWIEGLPLYIQIDQYFITHGFALEFFKYRNNKAYQNDLLFNRVYKDTIEPKIEEDIINIFGHCAFDEIQKGNKYICLDTACSYGGKLSAICLGNADLYQESLDKRDSNYKIKELYLKDIDTLTLSNIENITLKENCKYSIYDIVSNEVLEYILEKYPKNAKKIILKMKDKNIIFPKQVSRLFN